MKKTYMTRRALLTTGTAALGGLALASPSRSVPAAEPKGPFRFCLNTATLRGYKLSITEEVDIAGQAGYDGIEPWLGNLWNYKNGGGSMPDLRKRIEDAGLTLESAISFPAWIVDDDAKRAKGLEDAKRDMDLLAELGGKRIAAPPAGATDQPGLDLFKAAERYRALLELGDQTGVTPQLEVWGFSKNLSRLGECALVAVESGHPKACILGDVYHIYKGGSDFAGLGLLGPRALQVFHMNDYPADPPRDRIGDGDRVYPGDGVAPIAQILKSMRAVGATPVLSLELFNKTYWQNPPLDVARTGLEKMKAAVAAL